MEMLNKLYIRLTNDEKAQDMERMRESMSAQEAPFRAVSVDPPAPRGFFAEPGGEVPSVPEWMSA